LEENQKKKKKKKKKEWMYRQKLEEKIKNQKINYGELNQTQPKEFE